MAQEERNASTTTPRKKKKTRLHERLQPQSVPKVPKLLFKSDAPLVRLYFRFPGALEQPSRDPALGGATPDPKRERKHGRPTAERRRRRRRFPALESSVKLRVWDGRAPASPPCRAFPQQQWRGGGGFPLGTRAPVCLDENAPGRAGVFRASLSGKLLRSRRLSRERLLRLVHRSQETKASGAATITGKL